MHYAKYKRRAPKVYTAAVFSIEYAQLQVSQAKGWRKKNVYTNQQSHQLVGRGRMGTASDHLNPVHRMSLNNPLRCPSDQTSWQSTQIHD